MATVILKLATATMATFVFNAINREHSRTLKGWPACRFRVPVSNKGGAGEWRVRWTTSENGVDGAHHSFLIGAATHRSITHRVICSQRLTFLFPTILRVYTRIHIKRCIEGINQSKTPKDLHLRGIIIF